jgi:argininosuccinate lyase
MGRLVRIAAERDLTYRDVDSKLVDEAARDITGKPANLPEAFIRKALDPRQFVLERGGVGGTSPRRVRQMIASRRKGRAKQQGAIDAMLEHLERTDAALLKLVDRVAA